MKLFLLAALLLISTAQARAFDGDMAVGESAGISWMSGGVGDESLSEMRRMSAGYNVHLIFSGRSGTYLAAIHVKASRRNGQLIYEGVSDGPLLYLNLSPGSYRIAAEIERVWQTRRIQVAASGRPTTLHFVADSE